MGSRAANFYLIKNAPGADIQNAPEGLLFLMLKLLICGQIFFQVQANFLACHLGQREKITHLPFGGCEAGCPTRLFVNSKTATFIDVNLGN